jgi:hypothetical protein
MCSRPAVALLSAALSVSLAASAQAQERWRVDFEGGADNDEVYTFALVHYVAAGVVFRF